ncbi:MAG: sugar nucleotide-binding protein [Candidatus Berkelbacteria bacterium]|nr:sugar nucleotide-binding protein [Candidatus Berkelbacteria bacterium]
MNKVQKTILITGGDGYVGTNLVNFLKKSGGYLVHPAILASKGLDNEVILDITDKESCEKVIAEIKPDFIVHTAGLSSLAACEKDPGLAERINTIGTTNLAEAVSRIVPDSKFIFFSSDYVFEGDKGGYKEEDKKKPKTVYGKTKVEAENSIKTLLKNFVILRTANIFGRGGNFFSFVEKSLQDDEKIDVFSDVYFTPTYIDYLLNSIVSLLENPFTGVIHVAGQEKISRYQFATEMAKVMGKDSNLIVGAKAPVEGLISKDSSLNTDLAAKVINGFNPSISKAIYYHLDILEYPYFYFADDRGKIRGISDESWEEINCLESISGIVRGNHYHKFCDEGFFVVEGKIKVDFLKVEDKGQDCHFIAEKGDVFKIYPYTLHTFETLEDSKWINFLTKKTDQNNKDIYKLN